MKITLNQAVRFFVMVAIAMTLVLFVALPALAAMQDASAPAAAASTAVPLAARVLAVATIVFSILQGAKMFFPGLGGVAAVIINVALNFVGSIVAAPAGTEIISFPFLFSVLAAALGSAGIHGTLRSAKG